MPRVPVLNINNRVSEVGPSQPTIDPRQAGMVAGALSQLGGQIGQIGTELYKRRQVEDIKSFGMQSKTGYDLESNQLDNGLKEKYKGTDHKGYTEELQTGLTKLRDKYLKTADSDAKKKYFEQLSEGTYRASMLNADDYTFKMRGKFNTDKEIEAHELIGVDGDYIKANADLKTHEAFTDNSDQFSLDQKQGFKQLREKKTSELFRTMINNEQFSLAKAVLEGKDTQNTDALTKNMSAYEKSKLNAMIDNGLNRKKAEVYQSSLQDINNAMTAVATGELKASDALVKNASKKIDLLPAEKREPLRAKMAQIALISEVNDSFALIPPSERNVEGKVDAMVENIKKKNPLLAASIAGETKQQLANQNQKLISEFNKNPAEYFFKHDADLRQKAIKAVSNLADFAEYKNALNARYDSWGVDKEAYRKISNPAFEQKFGKPILDVIKMPPDKADKLLSTMFTDLKNIAGDDMPQLLAEMKIPEKYAVAGEMLIPSDMQAVLKSTMIPLDKQAYMASTGKSDKNIKSDMEDLADHPIYRAYNNIASYGPEKFKNADAVLSAVNDQFMMMKKQGADDSQASAMAWKLFENSYDFIDDSRKSVIIPKDKPYDKQNISNFMDDYIEKLDDPVAKGTYKWVTSADRKSVSLMAHQSDETVLKEYRIDGKPIRFTFAEMDFQKNPEPPNWMEKKLNSWKDSIYERLQPVQEGLGKRWSGK